MNYDLSPPLRNAYRRVPSPVWDDMETISVERGITEMSLDQDPEKTGMIDKAYAAIRDGAKKIDLENAEWEVTAYKMGLPGQTRIDIKRKDNK